MLAVIKTGGKQYAVKSGDVLSIEKLPAEKGGKIIFDEVLLSVDDANKIVLGKPFIKGAKVEASVVKQYKDKKIDVFKFHSKTRYRRRYGHRQPLTQIKIEKLSV